MKKNNWTRHISLCTAFLIILLRCSQNPSPLPPAQIPSFEPRDVETLEISKQDPTTGDRWQAFLERDHKRWVFRSTSANLLLLDKIADDIFVNHLLDALRSLKIDGPAPHGNLESYGLDPARIAIRCKLKDNSFEMQFGSSVGRTSKAYFNMSSRPGERWIVSGSALNLLGMIDQFQFLRKKTWLLTHSDDVDEIQVIQNGTLKFFAQREGEHWTDQKHRIIKKDIATLLEKFTSLQIDRFLDDQDEAKTREKWIDQKPAFEVHLLGRRNNKTSAKIRFDRNRFFGKSNDRNGKTFMIEGKVKTVIDEILRPV